MLGLEWILDYVLGLEWITGLQPQLRVDYWITWDDGLWITATS